MAKQRNKETTTYRCACCDEPLTDDNCRQVPSEFSESGYSAYCVECENRIYNHFAQSQGKYHALLTACGAFNAPLKPLLLEGVNLDEEPDGWLTYINLLADSGQDRKNGKVLGFADGATTLWSLFGNKLGEPNFEKRIALEKEKIKKQVGTDEQRERWGTEPLYISQNPKIPKLVMTTAVYNELDRIYANRAEALKGTTITPQIDFTLQEVAKNTVIYSHQRRHGERDKDKTWKDIDSMLASEQLRKKDEKPIANFAPDAWITAFEKAGLMEDGQFLTLPEIEDTMIKIMRGKGYDQTLDAAHQLELNIVNNARKNADQQTVFELPEDMRITDELGEFADEESAEEKEAKEYGHLTTVRFENGENK